ncbi:MAG: UDP-N-acetylmuramate dehydrogenase, partial [Candidatus Cloacimonetes bacterium]|nr:UDP-N-acetylmuramate dehydrogenase [Candidatus Cloacimonadota bacterium]
AIINGLPYLTIGKGSNLLVRDNGIRGIVICTQRLSRISRFGDSIYAECGTNLKELCDFAEAEGLGGLEFASGIPGSVGGAVFMNAGAYEGEMKDTVKMSLCICPTLRQGDFPFRTELLTNPEHQFSYRNSVLQSRKLIHLYSVFTLFESDRTTISAKRKELDEKRRSKQPLDLPSAGSVFKRPSGFFTGKLIDDCGLRGYRIGGAEVSNLHCGFIVNKGNATARDVEDLILYVQQEVFKHFRVELTPEIRIIGEE